MTASTEETQASDSPEPERPSPLSVAEIVALVRAVVDGNGSIIPTDHFKKRGRQRDFSTRDALEVLRTGMVSPVPLWNDNTEAWNYDIAGQDIEGESLTVRVAPTFSHNGVVLVTAF